ncbi:MAG: 3-oxoacyl-ACP synthase III [Oligoflexia bacterium]|nr:3-oxoacyl-ACP synthase III [Oligoflexia bacterium]MBF0366876.1 3-oxoacyl-ACP synthase III [Oligoflexia bacterium]
MQAMAYELPETIITSDAIEGRLMPIYERFGLRAGRLELMTGIKERRAGGVHEAPSVLAIKVANRLLEETKIAREEIELLIFASVCRDFLEPATAAIVHHGVGLAPHCQFFDLSNACLGVASAMVMMAEMIERGSIRRGLIVASENGGPLLEKTIHHLLQEHRQGSISKEKLKKHFASFTIGSGAFAMVLGSDEERGPRLLGGSVLVDSHASHLCQGGMASDGGGLLMETDAEALLVAGCNLAVENWKGAREALSWENTTPDHLITHQVGEAHLRLLCERLELPRSKVHTNYHILGNTGSVAMPISLCMASESGAIKAGEVVGLLGIGSGLSSIMLGVRY